MYRLWGRFVLGRDVRFLRHVIFTKVCGLCGGIFFNCAMVIIYLKCIIWHFIWDIFGRERPIASGCWDPIMVSTKQASGLIAVRVRVPPFGIGKFFSLATSCPSLSDPHLPHVSGRTYHFLAEVRILCVTPAYSFSAHQIMLSPLYFLFYPTLRILHVKRFGISGKFQVFFLLWENHLGDIVLSGLMQNYFIVLASCSPNHHKNLLGIYKIHHTESNDTSNARKHRKDASKFRQCFRYSNFINLTCYLITRTDISLVHSMQITLCSTQSSERWHGVRSHRIISFECLNNAFLWPSMRVLRQSMVMLVKRWMRY